MTAKKRHTSSQEHIFSHEDDLKHHAKIYHKHADETHHGHTIHREENEAIEEGLHAIYGAEKDRVDFTKLDRSRGRLTRILLRAVIMLALVAGLSWGAFFAYNTYFAPTEQETFSVDIEAPATLRSGEETSVRIHYKNPLNVPLAALTIDVQLPPAFSPSSMAPVPDNLEELIWNIGSIGAGSDGVITIEGTWVASVPSSTPVQVFADYRPANFNSDFQAIKTLYIDTEESVLETTITGEEDGQPGETLAYTVNVTNTGSVAVNDVAVHVGLPDGFFLESSKPGVAAGEASTWHFPALEAGTEETITLSGSFAADKEGFQYLNVTTSIESPDRSLTQQTVQALTDLVPSNIALNLVVNGTTDNVNTELDKDLRVSIAFQNNGEADLEGATLLLDFQSTKPFPIIWSKAELAEGTITADGIYWDNDIFGTLTAGEQRIMNLSFPLETALGSGQTDAFTLVAQAQIGNQPIRSTPIHVAINSDAGFTASIRYYNDDGAPIGSGPLPPKVGETTRYRLLWDVTNSLHDLDDVEVSASLPPGVSWLNETTTDLGSINYNEATRTITWRITRLPTSVSRVEATVDFSVTPETAQVGKFMKLVSGSSFRAKDTLTTALLQNATNSLDTELPEDKEAQGKGVVVE